jgi:hypothetical protein
LYRMAISISMTIGIRKVALATFLSMLLTFVNFDCISQDARWNLTSGLTWRSTVMNFFNLKGLWPSDFTVPYSYERNVQGFSLNLGVKYETSKYSLEYYPNFRYDVTHRNLKIENDHFKSFIIDHNINFLIRRKISYGLGMSIINYNKGFEFENPVGVHRYKNIEFSTINCLMVIPMKKRVFLELKALFIPKGFPLDEEEKYVTYSMRAYYQLPIQKKK